MTGLVTRIIEGTTRQQAEAQQRNLDAVRAEVETYAAAVAGIDADIAKVREEFDELNAEIGRREAPAKNRPEPMRSEMLRTVHAAKDFKTLQAERDRRRDDVQRLVIHRRTVAATHTKLQAKLDRLTK